MKSNMAVGLGGRGSHYSVATRTVVNVAEEKAKTEMGNACARLRLSLESRDYQGSKVWFQSALVALARLSVVSKMTEEEENKIDDSLTDSVVAEWGEENALEWADEVS